MLLNLWHGNVLFGTKNQRFQKSWFPETLEFQGFCSTTQFHHIWSCICNNRSRKTHQGCFPSIWVSISNIYFPLVRGLHYCTSLYKINRSGAVRIFSIRLCIISASKKKIRSFIKTFAKTPGQNTISFLTSRRVMCSFWKTIWKMPYYCHSRGLQMKGSWLFFILNIKIPHILPSLLAIGEGHCMTTE